MTTLRDVSKPSFALALSSLLLVLSMPIMSQAQETDPFHPFEEPLITEQELIQKKNWNQMSQAELQKEHDKLKTDLSLIEKRLEQLRGKTRLNQDQYREKEILDELSYIKQRELAILEKLIRRSSSAPDFRLPSTQGKEIALRDFLGKKHLLLAFYLFDFSPV